MGVSLGVDNPCSDNRFADRLRTLHEQLIAIKPSTPTIVRASMAAAPNRCIGDASTTPVPPVMLETGSGMFACEAPLEWLRALPRCTR
jgi:hypothetical protein